MAHLDSATFKNIDHSHAVDTGASAKGPLVDLSKPDAAWPLANPKDTVSASHLPGFSIEKDPSGNEVKRGFVNNDGSSHMEFPDGMKIDKSADGTAILNRFVDGGSDTTYRKADGTMEKSINGKVMDLSTTGSLKIDGSAAWQPTSMNGLLGEALNRPKYEDRFPAGSDFERLK